MAPAIAPALPPLIAAVAGTMNRINAGSAKMAKSIMKIPDSCVARSWSLLAILNDAA